MRALLCGPLLLLGGVAAQHLTDDGSCLNKCSGHGICEDFECACTAEWTGTDCSVAVCSTSCSGHGVCYDGECYCDVFYQGKQCEQRGCGNDCSGHGTCADGICECDDGWASHDCSEARCPLGCAGHGECSLDAKDGGMCFCVPGWGGVDCAAAGCVYSCAPNGVCSDSTGQCECHPGFRGDSCDKKSCPRDCSGHGVCNADGVCVCSAGWSSSDCGTPSQCGPNCARNGKCLENMCVCQKGWTGLDCIYRNGDTDEEGAPLVKDDPTPKQDLRSSNCPNGCSGHGVCIDRVCHCASAMWSGGDCSEQTCPRPAECESQCCGNGECVGGSCVCEAGFSGTACETAVPWCGLKRCSGATHGQCIRGADGVARCTCIAPFAVGCFESHDGGGVQKALESEEDCQQQGFEWSDDCSVTVCPNHCTDRGKCVKGVCRCDTGWGGKDCGRRPCPGSEVWPFLECSGHGKCLENSATCICQDGFPGAACQPPDHYFRTEVMQQLFPPTMMLRKPRPRYNRTLHAPKIESMSKGVSMELNGEFAESKNMPNITQYVLGECCTRRLKETGCFACSAKLRTHYDSMGDRLAACALPWEEMCKNLGIAPPGNHTPQSLLSEMCPADCGKASTQQGIEQSTRAEDYNQWLLNEAQWPRLSPEQKHDMSLAKHAAKASNEQFMNGGDGQDVDTWVDYAEDSRH